MTIIGLTGPTGAGKSTVAARLAEKGLYVADADAAARRVMRSGSPVLTALADAFGADILLPDGSLDRKKLAARAFATDETVQTLNRLTHPAITETLFAEIAAHADAPAAVIDAAALFESGMDARCDLVAVVLADVQTRLSRILLRDGLTHEEALRRISAQKDDDYYISRADVVLFNDGRHDLSAELFKLTERLSL